jgi:hypothetical protein
MVDPTGAATAIAHTRRGSLPRAGNRTGEDVRNPGNTLQGSIRRTFDALKRCSK